MHCSEPTVFVVDDEEKVTESLAWLIESVGYCVKKFISAEAFLKENIQDKIGCIILDVRMPGMSGPELQCSLVDRGVLLPIIFISAHGDVSSAVRTMKAGALDFLMKPVNNQLLLETVNKAIRQDLQRFQLQEKDEKATAGIARLTPREKEVMRLVVVGKMTRTIAAELGISPNTVELHRAKIMKKMDVVSVAELVHLVVTHDLTVID